MTVPLFDLPGFDPAGFDPAGADFEGADADGFESPGAVAGSAHEVTFLHTADWQLGMTRRHLDADAAHAYTAARHEAVERIGTLAAEVDAEFVVVSGDVFEDHRVSSKIIRRTLDALAAYGVPVYLLPGNHDPFDAAGIYRSRTFTQACPDNVTVLSGAGVHEVRAGVELIAAPWSHKQPGTDLVAAQVTRLAPADAIRVMVGHGGVDALTPGGDEALIGLAALEAAVDGGLLDYVALGDRHSVTSVGTTGRVWYPGAHEVTNFDHIERQPGHVLAVTLRRSGSSRDVDVVPHRVGQWSFRTVSADIAGLADIEALRRRLDDIDDKPRVVLQLRLVGSVSVTEGEALDELLEEAADRFASVTRPDGADDLVVVADDGDLADLGVGGYVREAAEDLFGRSGSTDVDDARTARDALALLHRLTGRIR